MMPFICGIYIMTYYNYKIEASLDTQLPSL